VQQDSVKSFRSNTEWEYDIRDRCWYFNVQLFCGDIFTHAYRLKGVTAAQQDSISKLDIQHVVTHN